MLCPGRLSTQPMRLWPVAASSKSDIYRCVATGTAQLLAVLLGLVHMVAVGTCGTLPRDSPKHWVELCRVRGLFPTVSKSVEAGKAGHKLSFAKVVLFSPFLHICLKKLGLAFIEK